MNLQGYGVLGVLAVIIVAVLVWAIVDGPGVRLSWADEGDSPFQVIVNNNIPSGGGGGGAPPLVLADFEVPETVSPVPLGHRLVTVTLPWPDPEDATYLSDLTFPTDRSYARLPWNPPAGYCSIAVRYRTDATRPKEAAFGWYPFGIQGNLNLDGVSFGVIAATQITDNATYMGLGFRLNGRATVTRVNPQDPSTWTYSYTGSDITFPAGSRIELLAIPYH